MLEYQSIKNFWEKAVFPIALKRFLQLSKLKTLCRGYMLLVILKAKILLERFTKKNCKKQMKKGLELKKQLKEKAINFTLNGKDMIILLTVELIKKT